MILSILPKIWNTKILACLVINLSKLAFELSKIWLNLLYQDMFFKSLITRQASPLEGNSREGWTGSKIKPEKSSAYITISVYECFS